MTRANVVSSAAAAGSPASDGASTSPTIAPTTVAPAVMGATMPPPSSPSSPPSSVPRSSATRVCPSPRARSMAPGIRVTRRPSIPWGQAARTTSAPGSAASSTRTTADRRPAWRTAARTSSAFNASPRRGVSPPRVALAETSAGSSRVGVISSSGLGCDHDRVQRTVRPGALAGVRILRTPPVGGPLLRPAGTRMAAAAGRSRLLPMRFDIRSGPVLEARGGPSGSGTTTLLSCPRAARIRPAVALRATD